MNIKTKMYIYTIITLMILSFIVFQSSISFKITYENKDNKLGWPSSLNSGDPQEILTIPQGNVGQKLIIKLSVSPTSSTNTTFSLCILDNNSNNGVNINTIYQGNITELNLIFLKTVKYNTFNDSNTFSFIIPFKKDGSYTVLFILSNFDISNHKNIQLFSNLTLEGQDTIALYMSILFLLMSILLLTMLLKTTKSEKKKNSIENIDEIPLPFKEDDQVYKNTQNTYIKINKQVRYFYSKLITSTKYEFNLLISSPFIIIFLIFLIFIIGDRYYEAYLIWLPSGESLLGKFGTTLNQTGLLKLSITLICLNLVITLFSFKEMEEEIFKIHITLPRSRNFFLFIKYLVFVIPDILVSFFYIGTTFILIPLRNPKVSIVPLKTLFLIFVLILLFSLLYSTVFFFISIYFLNSRNAFLANFSLSIIYLFYSLSLDQNFLSASQSTTQLPSTDNFTLMSFNKVFEYFIKTDTALKNTSTIMYNSILIIGFYLIIIFICVLLSIYFFSKRNF